MQALASLDVPGIKALRKALKVAIKEIENAD